jgi:biotin carboxyl carrier protein
MKILIVAEKKDAKPVVVDIPDDFADGTSFPVDVDGRKYVAKWSQSAGTLTLSAKSAGPVVEHSIPVRSMRTTRFPGESEATCDIECVLPMDSGPGGATTVRAAAQRFVRDGAATHAGRGAKGLRTPVLRSQITGKVLSVQVTEGLVVEEGTQLLVIEAMKMENRIVAPAKVRIAAIKVSQGASVSAGDELMRFEAADK